MKRSMFNDQRGFSLIELFMVVLIIGVLSTVAIMQFRTPTVDFERQRIVREFKIHLERARFDSVKRRAEDVANMARVTLTGPSSFTAAIDLNGDGILDPSETRVVDFTARSRTQIIVSDTLSYPVTLRFNQRGHVIATDGSNNEIDPLFTICSDCTAASPDQTVISVSTTGTVATLREGQLPSTLPAPATTGQNPTLDCYVLVAANSSCVLN